MVFKEFINMYEFINKNKIAGKVCAILSLIFILVKTPNSISKARPKEEEINKLEL